MKILVSDQTQPLGQIVARHQETIDPCTCASTAWGKYRTLGAPTLAPPLVEASAILDTILLVRTTPNRRAEET